MELLKQAVLKETFPSWSGEESFSVVKINCVISRLRINAVDFPETSACFIPSTGIYLSVAQASTTISADWRVHTWLLWIYTFLSDYLEKPIHTKVDKNLCLNIKYRIQLMDALLRKHKEFGDEHFPADPLCCVDIRLVFSEGTVYPVGNHPDPPFVPAPFALPNQGGSMIYLGVSNYFLKSASLAHYRAGAFNITISKEIAQSYTAAGPVLLRLMAPSPPAVSLNAGRCVLHITGCVEVFAVLPNSTTQYIFAGNLGHLVICTYVRYQLEDEEDLHSQNNSFSSWGPGTTRSQAQEHKQQWTKERKTRRM